MNNELKAEIENNFPGVEVIEVNNKKEKGIFKVNGEVVTMSTWKFIKEQKEKLNIQKLDNLSTGKVDWKTEKLKRAEKQELERLQKVEEDSIKKLETTNRYLHQSSKTEIKRLKQSVSESAGMIQRKNVRISELMEDNSQLSSELDEHKTLVDELTQKVEDVESSKKHLLGLYVILSLGLAIELGIRFYSFITG